MPRIVTIIVIIIVAIVILVSLARQINEALVSGTRLDQAAEEVNKLQEKNRNLKQKLSETQKYENIEEIARDKLNLAKPNETVVIIPDEMIDNVLRVQTPVAEIKTPNWQGWLRLFLH